MALPSRVGGSGGDDFEVPKVKPTAFVIGHVASIGWQGGGQYEPKTSVVLAFELAQVDSQGRRFTLFVPYTNSVNKKANLRKIVDVLDPGQSLDDPDDEYDLERLIGRVGFAGLKSHKNAQGKEFVTVDTVMELPEGMPSLKPAGKYDVPWGFWKYLDQKQMPEAQAKVKIAEIRAAKKPGREPGDDDSEIPF